MGEQSPFFVIGAPRSGTTYLAEVLNRHPKIFLTNETRIMTYLNRALNVLPEDRWILMRHREGWLDHLRQALPAIVEDFYRSLGAPPDGRWGDKHPHYADRRTDPQCLTLIDELFPESQFIHIIRDPRGVVASLLSKGWVPTLDEAIDVWVRHVEHACSFGAKVGDERYLELRYEELIRSAEPSVDRILGFLDVPPHPDVAHFIEEQRRSKTPFSEPTVETTKIGSNDWRNRLSADQIETIQRGCSPLLDRLGYPIDNHPNKPKGSARARLAKGRTLFASRAMKRRANGAERGS